MQPSCIILDSYSPLGFFFSYYYHDFYKIKRQVANVHVHDRSHLQIPETIFIRCFFLFRISHQLRSCCLSTSEIAAYLQRFISRLIYLAIVQFDGTRFTCWLFIANASMLLNGVISSISRIRRPIYCNCLRLAP